MNDPISPSHSYSTRDVVVAGGNLRVAEWLPNDLEPKATVLLIHGVTASHRAWDLVAHRLEGVRVIAPDLRGRGRSAAVAGPAGMQTHAQDMVAVLDAFDVERTTVVGHSMGGFVAAVMLNVHPERVHNVVLLDGGLPLDLPEGLTPDEIIQAVLGPTAERLSMRFQSTEDYIRFWHAHPGFANYWNEYLDDYFAYDLQGSAPELHPATSYEIAREDTVDLTIGTDVDEALKAHANELHLVTCPRGLFDQQPGLFSEERIAELLDIYPGFTHEEVPDTNHYTIVMSHQGAERVAEIIKQSA